MNHTPDSALSLLSLDLGQIYGAASRVSAEEESEYEDEDEEEPHPCFVFFFFFLNNDFRAAFAFALSMRPCFAKRRTGPFLEFLLIRAFRVLFSQLLDDAGCFVCHSQSG